MKTEVSHAVPPEVEPPRPSRALVVGWAVPIAMAFGIIGGAYLFSSLVFHHFRGKSVAPKQVMRGLEYAIHSYRTEYLRLPSVDPRPMDNAPIDTTDPDGRAIIDILLAKNAARNPREIVCWEPTPRKKDGSGYTPESGLVDSWGKRGYRIILDYNEDGKILNPARRLEGEPEELTADVILYSAGKDGDFLTWDDNVCSWK